MDNNNLREEPFELYNNENDYYDNDIYTLQEESEPYEVNNKHDKIFRTLLTKKEGAVSIINRVISNKITKQDIERYTNSYVTQMFQNREADIVYKLKNKDIFFLIEHQTKIDYLMPIRILEYQAALMRIIIKDNQSIYHAFVPPLVVPIVLYTGTPKWSADVDLEKCQVKLEGYYGKLGKYNLVDVNELSNKELLNDDAFISKIMMLEKGKDLTEIIKMLNEVMKKTKEEDKELLKNIIFIAFNAKLGTKRARELVDKINGGDEAMLNMVTTIKRENLMYINKGKEKGKKQKGMEIVKNMLKEKFSLETIQRLTGVKKEEIEKLM